MTTVGAVGDSGLASLGLEQSREVPCGDAMGPLSPEAGSTGYVNEARSAGADRFLGRGAPMADDSRAFKVEQLRDTGPITEGEVSLPLSLPGDFRSYCPPYSAL